jgi:hypothetical protein
VRRPALVLSWSVVAAAVFAAAALYSALTSARVLLPDLDTWKDEYSRLEPIERERAALLSLGFDTDTWVALRASLRDRDRYHIAAEVEYQHEIRNYAGYALLPAVLVSEPEDADAVVYWAMRPQGDQDCVRIAREVCVVYRPS